MTDIADRVQGMVGSADRWQKVSPKAVVAGSTAQAENVLAEAIHDIGALWRAAQGFADTIAALRQELAEVRAKALEEAAVAVGKHDAAGREWSPDSFWGQVTNEAVARIRALDAGKEG